MTFTVYPFENQDTTETQYQRIMASVGRPGIIRENGSAAYNPTDAGGLNIKLAAGVAQCRGMIAENDGADPDATVRVAEVHAQSRVGRLVMRFDPAANSAYPFVHLSAPGSSVLPLPVRSAVGGIYDVKVARFSIAAGAPGFAPGAVVSEREWMAVPVERWTNDQRDANLLPPQYQLGHNLSTGRMEYWTGTAWAYYLDSERDAILVPWTDVPLAGGVKHFRGGASNIAGQATAAAHNGLRYMRQGHTVWMTGAIETTTGSAFAGGSLLGVVPAEVRPTMRLDFITSHGSQVSLNPTNGDLRLNAPTLTPLAIIQTSWSVLG